MIELQGKNGVATIFTDLIEEKAISQIIRMMNNEITEGTVVKIMPDVHAGKGSTIGTTIKLPEKFEDWKVCPNIVGVDVGCGILMYKLKSKPGSINLQKLDKVIHDLIPSGFNVHNSKDESAEELISKLTINIKQKTLDRIVNSLGTLGGGNHFIELGIDEENNYWLSVHSGSRNLGVQVAKTHQDIAIESLKDKKIDINGVIEELKSQGRHREIEGVIKELNERHKNMSLGEKDLAYLQGENLKKYLHDMTIAQKFAIENRKKILDIIVNAMELEVVDKFDSIHNFIEHDNFTNGIIRKGATSAYKGERLVIPLNMRDGSLICVGKGNSDWNNSAPHGAGRMMSRSKAKENIKLNEFKEQMKEIYSSTVSELTLDEAPDAYKPADVIKENIKDTADILHQVKSIYNYKG